ncbi:MAG: transporter substrate-binding domain-containing protein [Ruminococcaceae bacterium]|nr:transporter substrate-binding domain-containing protein [Oscillospiraceae bacterium]
MKKFVKVLSAVLALIMMVGVFSSCGSEKEVLYVATNAEFPPFETLEDGEITGFDIDLINAIAAKLEMEVKLDNVDFDGVISAVTSGADDVAISGLTINEKRKQSVDFSDAYFKGAAQILIVAKDDTHYTGKTKAELDEQLKNQSIGVCTGFTGAAYAQGDEEWGFKAIEGADVKIYDNISLAIADLKNGNINAIIMDDIPAKEAVATEENKNDIKCIDVALTVEEYGIAVKKGNKELLDKINQALKELEEEGELQKIADKWGVELG